MCNLATATSAPSPVVRAGAVGVKCGVSYPKYARNKYWGESCLLRRIRYRVERPRQSGILPDPFLLSLTRIRYRDGRPRLGILPNPFLPVRYHRLPHFIQHDRKRSPNPREPNTFSTCQATLLATSCKQLGQKAHAISIDKRLYLQLPLC